MIMVTANVLGNVEAKALAAGFSAFVAKPILDMQALVDQIHRLSRDYGNSAVS
jgi:CheY-like chemotaxis protein